MTLAIYRRVTAMKWIENGRIFGRIRTCVYLEEVASFSLQLIV